MQAPLAGILERTQHVGGSRRLRRYVAPVIVLQRYVRGHLARMRTDHIRRVQRRRSNVTLKQTLNTIEEDGAATFIHALYRG